MKPISIYYKVTSIISYGGARSFINIQMELMLMMKDKIKLKEFVNI